MLSVRYGINNIEVGLATEFGIWVPLFCSASGTGVLLLASDEPGICQEQQAALNGT
jgi:hypothetical protein